MYLDADLYDRGQPLDSVIHFLTVTLKELKWNDGRKNVVMDVGCGPGNTTIEWILPLFSNLDKLIALDSLPSMIERATAKNCHPKVEYHIADFNDRSAVERWKGKITKLISVNCFHWFKDQEKSFQLVYDLLQPGGEAACYFLLESYLYDAMIQIKSDPKWKDYFEEVDMCIPESHFNKYDSSHYRKMVENIGFEVVLCQSEIKINRLPSHEKAKDRFYSVCPLVPLVPENQREIFKEELYQCVLEKSATKDDEMPLHKASTLEIVIKKPD